MQKEFTIFKRLGFSYSTRPLYRGIYVLPTLKLYGFSYKNLCWRELCLGLSFRFLFIAITIHIN